MDSIGERLKYIRKMNDMIQQQISYRKKILENKSVVNRLVNTDWAVETNWDHLFVICAPTRRHFLWLRFRYCFGVTPECFLKTFTKWAWS